MADVFREVEESLREDRALAMAKRYGPIVAVVVVLVLAAVGGWTYWQSSSQAQAEQRTAALAEAIEQIGQDPASARQALAAVSEGQSDGPAMLARFYEAQILINEENAAAAAEIYDGLAADTSVDEVWRDLAAIRAAILLVGTADPAEMRGRLGPFIAETSPWRFTANELMALVALRDGNQDEAIGLLERLRDDVSAPLTLQERSRQLLDSLGQ
ncbi:MAG: tetratricopeptide repeat protein [Pseudomonadota bacterium]